MLVERHISWIALNNVIGCPNKCKYCFLGSNVGVAPKKICNAKEAVNMLVINPLYNEHDPVAVMVNTEIFSSPDNIKECFEVLEEMKNLQLKNQIVLVTKRLIDINNCVRLRKLRDDGLDIIVYVSYSGLPEEFEVGNHLHGKPYALETMANLYRYGIPVVHYWRPLIPQNSTKEKINEVLNYVTQFCKGSVITGLKLYKHMNCEDYWPEAQKSYNEDNNVECFFPKGVLDIIKEQVNESYPVYVDNFCMLAYLEGKACEYGIYNTSRCKDYNICPYHKYQKNPCSSCNLVRAKICQDNYWGNSLTTKGWKEI